MPDGDARKERAMALDSYANLQAAVLRHVGRDGDVRLEAALPDLVALAEQRLNYGSEAPGFSSPPLRVREMETRVTASFDEAIEDLPEDWLEMRSLKLLTTPYRDLVYRTPQQFDREFPGNGGAGQPGIYTLLGSQVRLGPAPDGTYPVEMLYFARIPGLSPARPSNWLLAKAPGIYLYGALLELMPFIRSDDRFALWFGMFSAAAAALQAQDERARWSGDALTVRADCGNAP
jgi:hypothetical protein